MVPFLSQYLRPLFAMIWLRGLQPSSRGDRASPWYTLQLMVTLTIGLQVASRVVFHSLPFLLMKALSLLSELVKF